MLVSKTAIEPQLESIFIMVSSPLLWDAELDRSAVFAADRGVLNVMDVAHNRLNPYLQHAFWRQLRRPDREVGCHDFLGPLSSPGSTLMEPILWRPLVALGCQIFSFFIPNTAWSRFEADSLSMPR